MKTRILILVAVIAVIAGIATVAGLSILRNRRAEENALAILTQDAVATISAEILALCHEIPNPTPAEIDARIDLMRPTCQRMMGVDARGKTVDLYGTPFQVTHTVSGTAHVVTAASAGPDQRFNTPDDVTSTRSFDLPGPAKK